ncbi:MAG: hypothetical protein WBG37_21955 [Desulfobacterales bacterium]|jgi:hypothetical protein
MAAINFAIPAKEVLRVTPAKAGVYNFMGILESRLPGMTQGKRFEGLASGSKLYPI